MPWVYQDFGNGNQWLWVPNESENLYQPAPHPADIAADEIFTDWEKLPQIVVNGQIVRSKHGTYYTVPTTQGTKYLVPAIYAGENLINGMPSVAPAIGNVTKDGHWGSNADTQTYAKHPFVSRVRIKGGNYSRNAVPGTVMGFYAFDHAPGEIWHNKFVDDDWANWFIDNGAIIVIGIATAGIGAAIAAGAGAATAGTAAVVGGEIATGAIISDVALDAALWADLATGWEGAVATSSLQNAALAAVGGDVAAYTSLISAVGEVGAADMIAEAAAISAAEIGTTASNLLDRLKDLLPNNVSDKVIDMAKNKAIGYAASLLLNDPATTPHGVMPFTGQGYTTGGGTVATDGTNADTGGTSTTSLLLMTIAVVELLQER